MKDLINSISTIVGDILRIILLEENPDEDDKKGRQ